MEGTSSYGATLTRQLQAAGVQVTEVNRPDRSARRRHGKTDMVDAEAAARTILAGTSTAVPKAGNGAVETMRILKVAKGSAVKARVQAINQIKAILVNADPVLREESSKLGSSGLIRHCADLDPSQFTGVNATIAYAICLLARRVQHLATEIRELTARLTAAVKVAAPKLLELRGVGPDSAATLLIAAGDNPERLRSEASFAALCGVSPVQESSGKTQRHRLNRGGDRQANAALFRAVLTSMR